MDDEIRNLERDLGRAKARIGVKQFVVVRGRDSGAHAGYLEWQVGQEVKLSGSRRLWEWFGCNTLSEVSQGEIDVAKCKFAVPVTLTIIDAIEVIECTDAAREKILSVRKFVPE